MLLFAARHTRLAPLPQLTPHTQVAGITEDQALFEKYQTARDAAMGAFGASAMGEAEMVKEYEEKLTKSECAASERWVCAGSGG
jgi:hypothetical protein